MKTQIELARAGIITEQMQTVAVDEKMDATTIRDCVAKGQIVIPHLTYLGRHFPSALT